MPSTRTLAPVALGVLLTLTGCTAGAPPGSSAPATAAGSTETEPAASPALTGASPSAVTVTPDPTLEPPPEASLTAGDATVPGALGAWTWRGGSESAPWLPATALDPVEVAAGTDLTLGLAGDPPIERWSAVRASADDTVGADTEGIGEGSGPVHFPAPDEPSVVAVHVVFADGAGDATWYWFVTPS